MAQNKKDEFSTKDVRLSELAKSMAHPARIAILKFLATKNSCICGDIVDELPLAQSTVSQHLKELKNAGLIKGTIDGTSSCYCINQEALEKFAADFNELITKIKTNQAKSCC